MEKCLTFAGHGQSIQPMTHSKMQYVCHCSVTGLLTLAVTHVGHQGMVPWKKESLLFIKVSEPLSTAESDKDIDKSHHGNLPVHVPTEELPIILRLCMLHTDISLLSWVRTVLICSVWICLPPFLNYWNQTLNAAKASSCVNNKKISLSLCFFNHQGWSTLLICWTVKPRTPIG